MWSSGQWPLSGGEIFGRQVWTSLNKSVRVHRNASVKPMSIWYCSSHNEQMTYIAGLDLAGHVIPPAHALQMITTFKRCDL
jgi:hypothetical protein